MGAHLGAEGATSSLCHPERVVRVLSDRAVEGSAFVFVVCTWS